jgi:hypothetical protein
MLESFLIWLLLIWKSHIQVWSLPCVMVHRSIEICHPPSARWCLTKNGGFTLLHCIISRQYTIMKPLECLHFAFPGPKSESISSGATWKWQVDSFAMMGPYQTWLGCGDGWTNIQTPMSGKMWDGLGWCVCCILRFPHFPHALPAMVANCSLTVERETGVPHSDPTAPLLLIITAGNHTQKPHRGQASAVDVAIFWIW